MSNLLDDYLTTLEASRIAKTTPESIARACRRKTLAAIKHGDVWFVRRQDLDRYLSNKPKGRVKKPTA